MSVLSPAVGSANAADADITRLIARYGGRVPRYTSYPTAPHFTPAVGAGVYARWLAELPAETTLSLYLHVPFCDRLCLYCGCNTSVVRLESSHRTYAAQSLTRDRPGGGADRGPSARLACALGRRHADVAAGRLPRRDHETAKGALRFCGATLRSRSRSIRPPCRPIAATR